MASGTTDTCMSLLGADQKGFPEAERSMKRGKRERKKLNKKIERERESHTFPPNGTDSFVQVNYRRK